MRFLIALRFVFFVIQRMILVNYSSSGYVFPIPLLTPDQPLWIALGGLLCYRGIMGFSEVFKRDSVLS